MATVGQQLLAPESGYTRYLFTDSNFTYSSGWANNMGSDMISGTIGDTVKFNFYGDSIYLLVYAWSNRGKMSISIDGEPPIEYTANIGSVNDCVAFIVNNLGDRWHDVTITVISATASMRAVDVKGSIKPYDESVRPQLRLAIKNPLDSKIYSLSDKTLIHLPNTSDKNMILHGLESGKEIKLDEPFNTIRTVHEDGTYTDKTIEPFSVYDYISDNPQVIIYTESDDDIIITTTTPPFTLYDEFGDEVEVLYYTDDENATDVNLVIEANWSPIDELEGDFEIVTYTTETNVLPHLEITEIPDPELVFPIKDINIQSIERFDKVVLNSLVTGNGILKSIFSFDSGRKWYTYDGVNFTEIIPTLENVLSYGITPLALETMDMIKFNKLRSYYDTFQMAYVLKINDITDQAATDELIFQVEMKGTWKAAIHGKDYDYEYPNNSTVNVTLYSNGDFKMNV